MEVHPEFVPITQIDIHVGNARVAFVPRGHGLGVPPGGRRNTELGAYEPDPSGALQVKLADQLGRSIPSFIDDNFNRFPDACEGNVPNPCPARGPLGQFGEVFNRLLNWLTESGAASQPAPAKPVPAHSCQFVSVPAGTA